MASTPTRPSACRWARFKRWASGSGGITSSPVRSGTPGGTKRVCWRPLSVTLPASRRGQMDRWCRDFDNWGICDTVCFCLFDKTPYAWTKVAKWSGHREEFVKRAAFALLASLALHDKRTGDEPFLESLRAHRRRRHRRAELRQEGCELGAALGRPAQRGAPRRGAGAVAAAWRLLRTRRRGGWGRTRSGTSPVPP